MHHLMLPLIISCTRLWSFARHLLWRPTTESKNTVKLFAMSQTIHTVCCEDDYFPKEKFNHSIVCFTQCTLFFHKVCFLLQICLRCVISWGGGECGGYVTRINAVLWHSARLTFVSLGLFTFARIACLLQLWMNTSELDYSIWATPK